VAVLVSIALLLVKEDIAVAFAVCFRLVGRKALEGHALYPKPFPLQTSLMAVT